MQIMRIWPVYLYCDLGAVLNLIYKIYFIIHDISFQMVYNVIFFWYLLAQNYIFGFIFTCRLFEGDWFTSTIPKEQF